MQEPEQNHHPLPCDQHRKERFWRQPLTIYGDVPSAAKDYADANEIPFVDLAGGIPGDANNDLEVDIQDLISLMNYLVKGTPCPAMDNADADGSGGKPNIQDMVWIINQLVK